MVIEALKKSDYLDVFKKEEPPSPDFHYTFNKRIEPIIVMAKEGIRICENETVCDRIGEKRLKNICIY